MNEKRILNSKEVAEILGVSEFTVRNWKAKSDLYAKTGEGKFMGPKFIIRGTRNVVYDLDEVMDFAKKKNYVL